MYQAAESHGILSNCFSRQCGKYLCVCIAQIFAVFCEKTTVLFNDEEVVESIKLPLACGYIAVYDMTGTQTQISNVAYV
jgi:hypothetical protein